MRGKNEGKPVLVCKLPACQEVLAHPELRVPKSDRTRPAAPGQKPDTLLIQKHLKSQCHLKALERSGRPESHVYKQTTISNMPSKIAVCLLFFFYFDIH